MFQSLRMSTICNRRGWRRQNSSIAPEVSMGTSRCMCSSESPDSLSVVIHERKTVLTRFSPLKDLSAEHVVTGRVHRILTSVVMLGHIQVVCRRVSLGVDGRLFWPWSFNCCCHFICQQCSSLSTQSGDGRSPTYISTNWLTLVLTSSAGMVTKTEGTMDSPRRAVCWWDVKRERISDKRWSSRGMDRLRQ